MKKLILLTGFLFAIFLSYAQIQPVTPGPAGVPPLRVKPTLRPADLTIRCSDISTSIESIGVGGFGEREYYTYISVRITVINSGQLASQPFTIRGLVAPNPGNSSSRTPPPIRYWDDKGSTGDWGVVGLLDVEAIAAGATFTRLYEHAFSLESRFTGTGTTFFFCALADYYKTTTEGNELNNLSVPIRVNNPR